MDRLTLSHIDEELGSSEVAALCFLCRDQVNRKRLEGIHDAKGLFLRLEERGLLDDPFFLHELLNTIGRADLLSLLETDSRRPEETDARPLLSQYRVMLYRIYEDLTKENFEKMKFLLNDDLARRQLETCDSALDLFTEMEKSGLLSNTKLTKLHSTLRELDQQLASTVQNHIDATNRFEQVRIYPRGTMNHQSINNNSQPLWSPLSITDTQPSHQRETGSVYSDAQAPTETSPPPDDDPEEYPLTHVPRGVCMVINNKDFSSLRNRRGTKEDVVALKDLFSRLGFDVEIRDNLTADNIRHELQELGKKDFYNHDALVVCVLSHGEERCFFGTDGKTVSLEELTQPFTSRFAPTLTGKPKLFFVQACQGKKYQGGSVPCPVRPSQEDQVKQSHLEEDAGPVRVERVPWDADFLLGMATVQECKSFRNTTTGSIYIQELCRQLKRAAESPQRDDILTVLTRVNREVSKGEYLNYKQMPEPKYTLTKKLVFKYVR